MEEGVKVTEEVTVEKTEDPTPAPAPAPEPPVDLSAAPDPTFPTLIGETAAVETLPETPPESPLSYLAHMNVWAEAEKRLGQHARSVTVHNQGEYSTLHASPATGPNTHQEFNLGRI